jgi:thermitase
VNICLKKCLFPALISLTLLAAWQGTSTIYASGETYSSGNNASATYFELMEADVAPIKQLLAVQAFKAQWTLKSIQSFSSTRSTGNIYPALVAVLDTGIDEDHNELMGRVVGDISFVEDAGTDDINGHGTAIAGIIAADENDGSDVTGIAPKSRLLNVKVADDTGRCQISALAKGIIWAVDQDADVINISIEIPDTTADLNEAVNYAWDNGVVIVAAAGNSGNTIAVYPAGHEKCLAVTAIRENGALAPLANYGDWVDAAAPGFGIYSLSPGNGYGYRYGTSFAAAHISGLAARLFSIVTDVNGNGKLNDEVRQAIEAGCN